MSARTPKTQRSYTRYLPDTGDLCDLGDYYEDSTLVLVVPEDAVAKCKHEDKLHITDRKGMQHSWCRDCGRLALWGVAHGKLPRILRVKKEKR